MIDWADYFFLLPNTIWGGHGWLDTLNIKHPFPEAKLSSANCQSGKFHTNTKQDSTPGRE